MKREIGIVAAIMVIVFAISVARQVRADSQTFDPKAYFQSRCSSCHGSRAERRFNPDLPEQQMVDAILNGRKAERPPDMPGFAARGINVEQAKALIAYMRTLKH